MLPWKRLAGRLLLSAAAGGVASLTALFPHPVQNVLAVGTVLALLYLGVGLLLPVFDAEERAMIRVAWKTLTSWRRADER